MNGATLTAIKMAPSPKSPPQYPDFCGRRRLQLEVQILNREIGFLEEELHSMEDLQPSSKCCKEVEEFVGSKPDALVPINRKHQRSSSLWKWLRSVFCFPISLLCCSCCQMRFCCRKDLRCFNCSRCRCPRCCTRKRPCQQPICCAASPCFQSCRNSSPCLHLPSCRLPNCCSCAWNWPRWPPCCDLSFCMPWRCSCCSCCREVSCSLPKPSCPDYSCGCIWSCPKCTEAPLCRSCCSSKSSCITGCLC